MYIYRCFLKYLAGIYWRTLRKLMPSRKIYWAGVRAHVDGKCLDSLVLPDFYAHPKHKPNYESALVKGLKTSVVDGDNVVIVGGGYGVTSVLASQLCGKFGRVFVYEGSAAQMKICNSVIGRNYTPCDVSIQQAIVGESIGVYGGYDSKSALISPKDLPQADILQLDCEGSELGILKSLSIRPRIILVETHGFLGAKSKDILSELCNLGYEVDDLGVAEVDSEEYCLKNDIRVLKASLGGA